MAHAKKPSLVGVDPELRRFVETLLSPKKEERYPTAEEAICDLPLWRDTGPAGAIRLSEIVNEVQVRVSLPSGSSSDSYPVLDPSPIPYRNQRSQPSGSGVSYDGDSLSESSATGRSTDVLEGPMERSRERLVVPGDRNAQTKTREDDINQAFAMASTSVYMPSDPQDYAKTVAAASPYQSGQVGVLQERRAVSGVSAKRVLLFAILGGFLLVVVVTAIGLWLADVGVGVDPLQRPAAMETTGQGAPQPIPSAGPRAQQPEQTSVKGSTFEGGERQAPVEGALSIEARAELRDGGVISSKIQSQSAVPAEGVRGVEGALSVPGPSQGGGP